MNIKQQTFITEYLRHRNAFTAYCLAYNVQDESKYDSIMSAANRLLNHPEVSSVINSVLDGIRQEVKQEVRAALRTELLTTQRKREILAKIATGEMYAVQVYKGKDCSQCTQHVWPTINQMLKAIDLDNKMVGLYTPPQANLKPHTPPAVNMQIAEQVDKFLQSLGITPAQTETSSVKDAATPKGVAPNTISDETSQSTPQSADSENKKSTQEPTKDNNQTNGVLNQQQNNLPRPFGTTFISPGGLINIKTNKNSDADEGKTQ